MEPYDLRRFLTGTPKKPAEPDGKPILGIGNKVESTITVKSEPTAAEIALTSVSSQKLGDAKEVVQPPQEGNGTAAQPEPQAAAQPEPQQLESFERDDYVAKAMHDMILASGWVPTRTTPESNYYFFTYLPPEHKRTFQQARVYLSKLNLGRIITIEGLTIPSGIKDRMNIIIRMQKTGGIDRLRNSKTITQMLDVNNYFNQNSQLVNDEGLRAVLSSYLREAEIL